MYTVYRRRHGSCHGNRTRLSVPFETGKNTMIDYEVDGDGIATIALNMTDRPMNVLNDESTEAIGTAVRRAIADDNVMGVIVTVTEERFYGRRRLDGVAGRARPAGAYGALPPIAADLARDRDRRQALCRGGQWDSAWRWL